jgi:NDP-sugar pyrophosphorylase family protein
MTKALILAAGYGTRLGELTKNHPKPTIQVGGKSVIEHIISNLHAHSITEIIVNVHYLPMIITEKLDSNALYYYEPTLLGHEGTINALRKWLEGDAFFVINGDTISNVDYHSMSYRARMSAIVALMDNWRCAGTWLYPPNYFDNQEIPVIPYRQSGLVWHDIGTKARLTEAKKYYEKKT